VILPILGNADVRGAAVAAEVRRRGGPDTTAVGATRGWLLEFDASRRLIRRLRTTGLLIRRRPEQNSTIRRHENAFLEKPSGKSHISASDPHVTVTATTVFLNVLKS
jgi:hypothetical protein